MFQGFGLGNLATLVITPEVFSGHVTYVIVSARPRGGLGFWLVHDETWIECLFRVATTL